MEGQGESQSSRNHLTAEARADEEEALEQSASSEYATSCYAYAYLDLRMENEGQVFSVPELASAIFSVVDQATLVACALVCRSWKEPALDELWKHLDSILPLFGLLFNAKALLQGGGEYVSCQMES